MNAPYRASLSAEQLAEKIVDPKAFDAFDASVFSFFSEVSATLQDQFINAMHIDRDQARSMADRWAAVTGYPL